MSPSTCVRLALGPVGYWLLVLCVCVCVYVCVCVCVWCVCRGGEGGGVEVWMRG